MNLLRAWKRVDDAVVKVDALERGRVDVDAATEWNCDYGKGKRV